YPAAVVDSTTGSPSPSVKKGPEQGSGYNCEVGISKTINLPGNVNISIKLDSRAYSTYSGSTVTNSQIKVYQGSGITGTLLWSWCLYPGNSATCGTSTTKDTGWVSYGPYIVNTVGQTTITIHLFTADRWTADYDKTVWFDNIIVRKYSYPEPTTSVGSEETNVPSNYVWAQSPAVASNPTATYTCPSCSYTTNTYYGVTYSVNESVWTAFTQALTFTCKKENLCSCSPGECFNECKNDPDGSGAWCCNSNQCSHDGSCYTLVELPSTGSSSACILGENIAHNTQGSINYRYAVYDGQLYYCGTSNADKDAYAETTDLIPGDKIGLCQCRPDGTWNCGGVVKIRGGRIRIVS
ncbi:MAG: hypothetical protein QXL14_03630, partial [Candidatus Aenigmatarchaeota archaeon]